MNHPEPLSLNQAATAAGVSRSTVKRRLPELEKAGAYRLPSGEWRIPPSALTVLTDGSPGSPDKPRKPGHEPPEPPVREPREPPLNHVTTELNTIRDALVQARLEAAEWKARAEERADRITELATRAEAAEARLDRMITSQTALALTLKEQQQITATATPAPTAGPVVEEAVAPVASPSDDSVVTGEPRVAAPEREDRPTVGERFRAWRANRRTR